jgi:hypothetical protein
MARMVVDGVAAFLGSVVGVLSDWALGLLPVTVKRRAVSGGGWGVRGPNRDREPSRTNAMTHLLME